MRTIYQQLLSRQNLSAAKIVTEPVRDRLHDGEGVHVGLLLRSIRASRRERKLHLVSGLLRSFLDGCVAADAQAVATSWEIDSPDPRILAFRAAMSCSPINS